MQTKDHLMEETQRSKAIRRFKTKKHAMGRVLIPFLNHLRAAKSDDVTTQNTHCRIEKEIYIMMHRVDSVHNFITERGWKHTLFRLPPVQRHHLFVFIQCGGRAQ